jgi:phosphohistidine phosphatase
MVLFLVQHGRSLPKEVDPDKGLSEEGRTEVARIAEVAAGYGVRVSCIEHSGKKRAAQTAAIFAAALKPASGVRQRSGLAPLDDVAAFAARLAERDRYMLVGHLPFMERLAAYLITGQPDSGVFKFQNGGILCLVRESDGEGWVIRWALMPHIE